MTSQFSPRVSEILSYSREEATRLASQCVSPEHLLMGILRGRSTEVKRLFERFSVNLPSMKEALESRVRQSAGAAVANPRELLLDDQASNILKLAVLEARLQRTETVDVQHLLLAMLHDKVNNGAKIVLEQNNMDYSETLKYFQQKAGQPQDGIGLPDDIEEDDDMGMGTTPGNTSQNTTTQTRKPAGKTPVLDNFSTDLTQAAAESKLDPVVGREKEMQRVMEIL